MTEISFGIGTSQRWRPEEAVEEAFRNAYAKINKKPKFVVFLSTVHYEKNNGFARMLAKLSELRQDTVLVGGSTMAFICQDGCFTRGVVILLGAGDIKVAATNFKNIRKSPEKTAESMLKFMSDSDLNDKNIMINFVSGGLEPTFFSYKFFRFCLQFIPHTLLVFLRNLLWDVEVKLGCGPAMEEDIIYYLNKDIRKFYLFGYSTFDDGKGYRNYQFFNNKCLRNSIVSLRLSCPKTVDIGIKHEDLFVRSGKKFNVTIGKEGYTIDLINGKPAVNEYLRLMGWGADYLRQIHVKENFMNTFYFPIGVFAKEGISCAFPVALFVGSAIATNRRIPSDTLELFFSSNHKLINFLEYQTLSNKKRNKFYFFAVAAHTIGTMGGHKAYELKYLLDKCCDGKPYLMIFGAGEHSKEIDAPAYFEIFSMAMALIGA